MLTTASIPAVLPPQNPPHVLTAYAYGPVVLECGSGCSGIKRTPASHGRLPQRMSIAAFGVTLGIAAHHGQHRATAQAAAPPRTRRYQQQQQQEQQQVSREGGDMPQSSGSARSHLAGTLVLAGPSGVGKSTLVRMMLEHHGFKDKVAFAVSHTTRRPRPGERDGVHYFFVDRPAMERMISEGEFLEYAEVHGNLYGTSIMEVDRLRASGRVCILDLDLQGVLAVQERVSCDAWHGSRPNFVLLKPKDGIETLEGRLRDRQTEDEKSLAVRLETARKELALAEGIDWDHVVVNDVLDETWGQLRVIVSEIITSTAKEELEADEPIEAQKSVFEEFSSLARELGRDCVDLGQGFPNFNPPEFVAQTLKDELAGGPAGRHQYTRTMGYPGLVEMLAKRYSGHLDRPIDPMREVAVTVGATNALFLSLQTALARARHDQCDVVVLEPFFELYRSQVNGLGARLRTVPLKFHEAEEVYELDEAALDDALGFHTAVLIVNTPHNPTGKVFTLTELECVAKLVRKHPHITVISDEVYKFMIFDPPSGEVAGPDQPQGHVHFAKLPGMWDQTVTVSSAGKTFGITGWQIGWAVGPTSLLQPIQKFMPNLQFCAPTLTQRALTQVLQQAGQPYESMPSYYAWLRADYAAKRDKMIEALSAAGIGCLKSQGGFFLCADIGRLDSESGVLSKRWKEAMEEGKPRDWAFSLALAREVGVVTLPVSPFFGDEVPKEERERFVRFCFAKTDETLEEAAKRLQRIAQH